ncbi:uncharacterized protein LOC121735069 isoform X2 [Aricia agestis]|uniref:uncharacterized protein LOC121735069 isoform X2 n=1 Tax=Aricia agestis TaxID=91739 RepID=UPI001C205AAE|nr:uncharacterized protein LOC121735069 isoform X2 [Aricia agestis]
MCLKLNCMCNTQSPDDIKLRYKMSLSGGSGAVFFLGSRAHYQVLDQPYDKDNRNTSTETIANNSVEELWPSEKAVDKNSDIMFHERQFQSGNHCIKRRAKRHSTEALLGEDLKPSALNKLNNSEPEKKTSRRSSVMQFFSSLSRRKRGPEVQYLQQMDTGIITCTYRESCRCLDCQGRYFECAEDSEDYSSDDEDHYFVEKPGGLVDDDLFLVPKLFKEAEELEKSEQHVPEEKVRNEGGDTDNQLQMEVAASTSAMLNLLLYHPFSCAIQ